MVEEKASNDTTDVPVDHLENMVQHPKEKEDKYMVYQEEKAALQDIMEKCGNVRGLTVCEEDEITVRVGRYWYSGTVVSASKLGLVLLNQSHEVAIALGKISIVEVVKRGRWYYEYKKLKG